jgi:hypothetical protein
MKNKLYTILTILLISMLFTSSASAGGAVRLTGVSFSIGSLIASGYASGLGNTDVTLVLDAGGVAATICTNPGNNDVPGQSYPKVSASGFQSLSGNDATRKNGKAPFSAETVDPATIAWDLAGCPNSLWTARIVNILWTNATISVHEGFQNPTGPVLLIQNYTCDPTKQTATTASCTLNQ